MQYTMIFPSSTQIKDRVEKLPLGKKLIVPLLRSAKLAARMIHEDYREHARRRTERVAAENIFRAARCGQVKEAILVFDLFNSPPSYGDYVDSHVMLARYLIKQNINVRLFLINSEHRKDWRDLLDPKEKAALFKELMEVAKIILDLPAENIQTTSWESFLNTLQHAENGVFVPFRKQILDRKPFYDYVFNVINHLMAFEDGNFRRQFLLSYDEIAARAEFKKPVFPYITWHARFSNKWRLRSNLSEDEFVKIYSALQNLYPEHAIMIVSDSTGCAYFKEIANKHGIRCLFSKDFSDTFIGDAMLILGSDYFFSLRGGGISVIAWFSNIPYEIVSFTGCEFLWRKGKITSWANDRQVFRPISRDDQGVYLPSLRLL